MPGLATRSLASRPTKKVTGMSSLTRRSLLALGGVGLLAFGGIAYLDYRLRGQVACASPRPPGHASGR